MLDFGSIDTNFGHSLLRAFWNRQHYTGSIVYRPAFMRDMAHRGRYFNDLLLNVIVFVAIKYAPVQARAGSDVDSCVNAATFRRTAEDMLYRADTHLLTKSSVTTIQALLLMANTLFAWCDEQSLSWQYLGIAINMIMDLGIHTTNSTFYQRGSAEDLEIGRRMFWAAYSAFHDTVSTVLLY
jgi:hypothetical protein